MNSLMTTYVMRIISLQDVQIIMRSLLEASSYGLSMIGKWYRMARKRRRRLKKRRKKKYFSQVEDTK